MKLRCIFVSGIMLCCSSLGASWSNFIKDVSEQFCSGLTGTSFHLWCKAQCSWWGSFHQGSSGKNSKLLLFLLCLHKIAVVDRGLYRIFDIYVNQTALSMCILCSHFFFCSEWFAILPSLRSYFCRIYVLLKRRPDAIDNQSDVIKGLSALINLFLLDSSLSFRLWHCSAFSQDQETGTRSTRRQRKTLDGNR